MNSLTVRLVLATALAAALLAALGGFQTLPDKPAPETKPDDAPGVEPVYVALKTTKGLIVLELDAAKAPITVENFLAYTEDGFYDGTIFHRVIPNFMIQGGGFTETMVKKETRDPIRNESGNGLKNVRGSIAMARTDNVNSATSQFFINVADNPRLDDSSGMNMGYTVFGKVVAGMDVADAIVAVPTTVRGRYRDVPEESIKIEEAKRITPEEAEKVVKGAESRPA